MTKDAQLRRRIIEMIHGCEYEECKNIERQECAECRACSKDGFYWISLARLVVAISKSDGVREVHCSPQQNLVGWTYEDKPLEITKWYYTNEDGSDCTLDQQSQETRDSLHTLLIGT